MLLKIPVYITLLYSKANEEMKSVTVLCLLQLTEAWLHSKPPVQKFTAASGFKFNLNTAISMQLLKFFWCGVYPRKLWRHVFFTWRKHRHKQRNALFGSL